MNSKTGLEPITEEQRLKRNADMRRWMMTPKGREYYARYNSEWRKRPENKVKISAHKAVKMAIARGVLTRPDNCQFCNVRCRPNAHHDDHTKKLEVLWLCDQCHSTRHKEKTAQMIEQGITTRTREVMTHCKRGLHELTPDNVYIGKSAFTNGQRQCKACKKEYRKRRYQAEKEKLRL